MTDTTPNRLPTWSQVLLAAIVVGAFWQIMVMRLH
jgi:hypothetical protein